MGIPFAFSLVGTLGFVVGVAFGTWDRRGVVKVLRTDRDLTLAQRRQYEREVLGLRCQLGIDTDVDDARATVLARESGVVFDEEDFA